MQSIKLHFLSSLDRSDFLSGQVDPRLRAFIIACLMQFPDYDWVVTCLYEDRGTKVSGHNRIPVSGIDLRSRTWSKKQLIAFYDWCSRWWLSKPDMIDVVIEDDRIDKKYLDKGIPRHVHCEVDRPYWRA